MKNVINTLKEFKKLYVREKADTILLSKLFSVEPTETIKSIDSKINEIDKAISVLEGYEMARNFMRD